MRLSDIFKKNAGTPAPQQDPAGQTTEQPAPLPRIPQPRPAPAAPAPSHANIAKIPTEKKQSYSAEQLYTELIVEIKSIITSLEKGEPFDGQLPVIPRLVDALETGYEPLLLLADRATPDVYLYGHSVNVAILSVMLGQSLQIERNKRIILGYCALLHDIGMVKTFDVALKSGKLTNAEYNQIKKHILHGQAMLQKLTGVSSEFREVISLVMAQIHERMNGTGYPHGTKGEELHEFGRIIAITDVYEAMTHPRSYRTRLIPHEAVKTVITAAGSEFDAPMVKVFVEHLSIYPPGSYVRLNTEEIARVTGIKRGLPTRPTVLIIIDPQGQRTAQPRVIDLSSSPMLFVKEAVDETKLTLTDRRLALELKAMRWWVKGL